MVNNSAFCFLKPAAVTEKMKELVKDTFEKKGIKILKEGSIDGADIDKRQLVDKHYYAIASKATLLTPDKLNIPKDKFKEQFGLEWDDVLKDGKALNAKDACEKLEVDADELDKMWGGAKKAKNLVKFGGGFYCAKLEKEGKGTYYVFNGFFMTMRSGYVKEGASIYYYVVEWDVKDLAWADFRGKVLGPTDPAEAPKDSLRGGALADWQNLGLASEPNTGENCVHASASPFEGLAEKMNWLGYRADRDSFGKALLNADVRPKTIKDWCLDPVVSYGDQENPTKKSIWDTLEDMDAQACINKCAEVAAWRPPKKVFNSAFVFLKPAAVTDKMKDLVKDTFEKKGIKILKEGSIAAADIDKKQLVDKHYYAIASKATLLTPDKLNIPKDKFKEQFGVEWDDVLKEGKALNAKDACEKLEVDADELDKMWGGAKKAKNLVKFGGGFYCAKLEKEGKGTYYVFNGFFMTMRSGYVKEGASIYYFVVEWEVKNLAWADFRGKVLGPTDPAEAPKDSLRGGALADWKNLGLASEPNTGENCVHASASPFEGLAERMNWLGYKAERDNFGKDLLNAGVRPKTIKDWCLDPVVQYGDKQKPTSKSIWDTIEDLDSPECIAKCAEIDEWRPLRKAKFHKVGKLDPEQKGVNFVLKCVSAPVAVEGEEIKEVTCGDDTGSIILSIRSDAQVKLCEVGAAIRIQNAHVKMVKGYMRLVVDKWATMKVADSVDFETVDEKNNMSKVEYELK
jgi:nucleoside diphosphate kinase